jgi:hypothetical protein
MTITIASYPETNQDNYSSTYSGNAEKAQCFLTPATPLYYLTAAKFYLQKYGSPTGNCYARLYAATAGCGSTGVPTGAVLATSDPVDVATIGAGGFALYTFTFSTPYPLSPSTIYAITFYFSGGSSSNLIRYGTDSSSPTDPGNFSYYDTSWHAVAGTDSIYYVLGEYQMVTSTIDVDWVDAFEALAT